MVFTPSFRLFSPLISAGSLLLVGYLHENVADRISHFTRFQLGPIFVGTKSPLEDLINQSSRTLQEFFHVTQEVEPTITEIVLLRDLLNRDTGDVLNVDLKLSLSQTFLHQVLLEIPDGP